MDSVLSKNIMMEQNPSSKKNAITPILRTCCIRPVTPISQPNFQLRRAQCCDFCSDLRIGSCTNVKTVVECASPRALKLRH